MATPVFVHGKLGTVSIAGTLFNSLQFEFVDEADLEDITYTTSGGATAQILINGIERVSGSISFVYDTANQPVIAPQNMRAGTLMALILYPEGTKPYTFSAFSGSFRFASGPQAGAVKCSTNFRSTGAITVPTS